MMVHVFKGPGRAFAFTKDASGANLPAKYAPWAAFKSIELSRDGEPVPGIDKDECLDDIQTHGFHVTYAHIRITDQFV